MVSIREIYNYFWDNPIYLILNSIHSNILYIPFDRSKPTAWIEQRSCLNLKYFSFDQKINWVFFPNLNQAKFSIIEVKMCAL